MERRSSTGRCLRSGEDRCEGLEHVRRVFAAQHGVQDPAVPRAVEALHRVRVGLAVGQRVEGDEVDRDADLRLGASAPEHLRRKSVGEQHVVRRRKGVRLARAPGSVLAHAVAEPRDTHGSHWVIQLRTRSPSRRPRRRRTRQRPRRSRAQASRRAPRAPAEDPSDTASRTARSPRRAARPPGGRRSRARPSSAPRARRGRCAATRSRSETHSGRALASAARPRDSGGTSRTRRRRCPRSRPCPESR